MMNKVLIVPRAYTKKKLMMQTILNAAARGE